MKRQTRNINNTVSISNIFRKKSEEDFLQECEDSVLQESINEYMKGRLELEEVKNDPGLADIEVMVKEMVSDYSKNKSRNVNDEKFIRDAFSEIPEEQLIQEISNIKQEIHNSKINDLTAEWVKDWHESRQKLGSHDIRREEIRDFIKDSLEEETENTSIFTNEKGHGVARSLYIRYASLSAAAVLGTFLLIKTVIPGSDPDRLFNKYYEPFDAVSPVTRSISDNSSDFSTAGIDLYKKRIYNAAASEFSAAVKVKPSDFESRFYLGVSEVELGNYRNAINLLSEISERPGDFGKDARWYLGMAYLKTGQKEKAFECFSYLAKNSNYYSKRSEKILRSLR